MKTALTIAGSDPTGGAGLQADLKVFRAFGVHGLSIPAALTSQNTTGVEGVLPVERAFFESQMDTLLRDIRPAALKTGMLFTASAVAAVAERIKAYSLSNLVVDPVTVSSSGAMLAEPCALDEIREKLFPLSKIITPNIYEASVLTGMHIENQKDMERAAIELKKMGPEAIVITGGHYREIRSKNNGETLDLIYDGENFHCLRGKKTEGEYHGTGCTFSAVITACLALGYMPLDSLRRAKEFVTKAINKAYHIGKGMEILDV